VRAVVACRLSRVHVGATGDETQLLNAHDYCDRRGWTVVGEASDLDMSAIKIDPWKRPELSYWLNNPHLFDALVFRSIDRMARKMFDFMDLLRWADNHGIRLVCLDLGDGIDFGTPEGKMVALGLAYAAEIEGKKITDRILGARKYMRRVGRWGAGRAPYGYRLCPHPSGEGYALEPDPDTARVVAEIVSRFLGNDREVGRQSRAGIAKWLNESGIPSPLAGALTKEGAAKRAAAGKDVPRWGQPAVTAILSNPALRGMATHDGKILRYEDGPNIHRPIQYGPPLVDRRTWQRIQTALDASNQPKGSRKDGNDSLLLGIIYCADCGHRMYGGKMSSRNREQPVRVYRCVSQRTKGTGCPSSSITAEHVEAWVAEQFLNRVGHRFTVVHEVDPGESHMVELEEVEDALAELREDRKAGLYRGERGTAEFRTMYGELEARREALEALPNRPPAIRTIETGITYTTQWDVSGNVVQRRDILTEAGVTIHVARAERRGARDWQSRLRFDMRSPEHLHAADGHNVRRAGRCPARSVHVGT
jgi:site-specific DNA recombinase